MVNVIDGSLVRTLIAQQFPELSHLPVRPVRKQGHDNRTFRLGDELSVRLPSSPSYADAVEKEATALATLRNLSVQTPEIVALGEPSDDYPLPWSIRRWLPGTTWEEADVLDRVGLAKALGELLVELRSLPADVGLYAGRHSFFRGCHPSVYGDEVATSLSLLKGKAEAERCLKIWQEGMRSVWTDLPVWFHGDLAVGNVLMTGEKVSALIDFGACGVGDPACDYAIAWTYFDADERQHFRASIEVDEGTWRRAKSWALWKALASLAGSSAPDTNGIQARALGEILRDET